MEKEKLDLVESSDPVLYSKAEEIGEITPEISSYAKEMGQVMEDNDGAGLAAPQVGLGIRMFVSQIESAPVAINPEILQISKERISKKEGCLSFPGKTKWKGRHKTIEARWKDLNGEAQTQLLHGMDARIFQHEVDHLNGICLWDERKRK